jgi:hypothetical protein
MQAKRKDTALEVRACCDKEGISYTIYRTPDSQDGRHGHYHVFVEIEAKEAIALCLGMDLENPEVRKAVTDATTHQLGDQLWKQVA